MTKKTLIPVAILVASAFALGIFFATAGANLTGNGERITAESHAASNLQPGPTVRLSLEQAFIDVAEAVNPAVVQVRTRGLAATESNPLSGTPLEQFFSTPDPLHRGIGSGVIVGSDGYIVTNNHVVANAEDVDVTLLGGRILQAELVGSDDYFDLALLKIDAEDLPTIPYGSAVDIRVGQWVMAFGSPLSEDLNNTVTAGIVSGLGRVSGLNRGSALIQTDAAINPGNSGGPLVDLQGRLIGINTLIATRTGVYNGIGFAVPVSTVANAIEQLKSTGRIQRGFLGVRFDRVPQPLSEAMGIPVGSAQVTEVFPGSAADRAGLEAGDIITAIDGTTLEAFSHLPSRIGAHQPGDEITLSVVRDDKPLQFEIRLGQDPDWVAEGESPVKESEGANTSFKELGLTLKEVDAQELRNELELDETPDFKGILVANVDPRSDAAQDALLRRNDVIIEAGQTPVHSVRDLKRVYDKAKGGEAVRLTVKRFLNDKDAEAGYYVTLFRTAIKKAE